MSYRSSTYGQPREAATLSRLMLAGLVAFVAISLVVMFAGQLPNRPQPDRLPYSQTYVNYVATAREQLTTYGRQPDGAIHMPIERAMNLIVEQNRIPVRSTTP